MNEPARTRDGGERPGLSSSPLTRAEFAAGFDRCWRTLWCVAVGVLGDRSQAEDVVQEAAVIAMGKLDEFDRETNLTAWLARIVRNVAMNQSRRRRLERAWSAAAREEAVRAEIGGRGGRGGRGAESDGGDGSGGIQDEQVLAALGILNDTARTCLLMRTVLDLSYREIAVALEIPAGTAMSHVHRARASLRAHLAPMETRTAAALPPKAPPSSTPPPSAPTPSTPTQSRARREP